jgi:LuxR family maltose regulon positive regulatory protein
VLAGAIINQIAEKPGPFVLVLDDVHTLHAQINLDLIAFFLAHIPPQLHLVMLTRIDPPLPLALLRSRNQLLEVRADQLRFTPSETIQYLNGAMGLELTGEDSQAMTQRTEGWIAGLQMAAISMQNCADTHHFISAFTGSHAYIMDYLTEEVLARQTNWTRSFLLRTSILERLCGALCDVIIPPETSYAPDGQTMLDTLAQSNAFIIGLDNERRWYRYHHLFTEMLRRRLEFECPDQLYELHRRASKWYEQHGEITESISHAVKGKDRDRAIRLFEENGCQFLIRGETTTLLKWIEAVEPFPEDHPWLVIQKAWALTLANRGAEAQPLLDLAEKSLLPIQLTSPVRTMLGTIEAARAQEANMQGNSELAAAHAQNALAYFTEDDSFSYSMRSVTIAILGDAHLMNGDLEQARLANQKAIEVGQAADDPNTVIMAKSTLADILVEQGAYRKAARIWSDALQMAAPSEGQISPLADVIYAGLGKIYYEWNKLEVADQYFRQSIQVSQAWGNTGLQVLNTIWTAQLDQLAGHTESANEAIRFTEEMVQAFPLARTRSIQVNVAIARWHIRNGNLEKATRWIAKEAGFPGENISNEITFRQIPVKIACLRLLLAQDDTQSALELSGQLLEKVQTANHLSRTIEVLVLQALILQKMKNLPQALATLERALILAEGNGFVRIFIDEGEPMARLIYQVKKHSPGDSYSMVLLKELDKGIGQKNQSAQPLIEPLSDRELEVLGLIAGGCTNQEIAARLVISPGTVKRHVSNIYAKLGVTSRTQAIGFARELKLIV